MTPQEIVTLVKETATGEVFGVWFLIGAALVFFKILLKGCSLFV